MILSLDSMGPRSNGKPHGHVCQRIEGCQIDVWWVKAKLRDQEKKIKNK